MKLKNKILKITTTALVSVVTPIAIIGCTKTQDTPIEPEVEPWDVGVTFIGEDKEVSTNREATTFVVGEFVLNNPLIWGQKMSVKSTKSDVSVVVGGYPERPQTPFSVTLALNNKPDESQKFNFGLIFTFVDEETEQTVNERVDNFVVNYTADWKQNTITWKTKDNLEHTPYNKVFTLTPGSTKYYTDYFTLGHELETPREKLTVSVVNLQGPNGITATIDKIDGRVVKLLFTVNIFEYVATTFDVQFQFWYNEKEAGDSILEQGFSITPIQPYTAPQIVYSGLTAEDVNLVTSEGSSGAYFDSYATEQEKGAGHCFKLDSPLGETDEIVVLDNKANIDTSCSIGSQSDESGHNVWVNLMASFNDVYDPYASGKVEEFIVTFQFYHDGELVREQKISNLPITLTYTPIPDPTGEPEKFGVVFNPVEVDSDGDWTIEFTGQIGRKGADSWEAASLHKGQFLTITNSSFYDIKIIEGEEVPNLNFVTVPAREYIPNEHTEEQMFSQGLPLEAIEGTDEGLTQIDVEISFAGGMLGELIPFVIDFDTTLTTQFYDYNPIGIDPEPKPNLGSSDSTIDFIYYPRGFWTSDSVTATDQWIADRTFALLASYKTDPNDESTREYVYGNSWILSNSEYGFYVVTSWDFIEKIKPYLAWSNEEKLAHGFRLGWADQTLERKYVGAGKTKYLTPSDFIYLDVISEYDPEAPWLWMDPFVIQPQTDFTWSDHKNGCDVCVVDLSVAEILEESDIEKDPWAAEVWEHNEEYGIKSLYRKWAILDDWEEKHDNILTQLEEENSIDNWDNWACAICSGYTDATIKVDGADTPALTWMTQNCKFDYGHLPEYKTIAESAAQNFNALGDIDGTSINHASPAYMLPDKFSKTDPENCWFGPSGTGAMFVIRQWDEIGKSLDIPHVAGINWNGGNIVSGVDLFNPWIDIFFNDGRNLLINYMEKEDPEYAY